MSDPFDSEMDVETALVLLDQHGSHQDPIYVVNGTNDGETTPEDFIPPLFPRTKAKDIRIGYTSRTRYVKRGTLLGMVRDRMGLKETAEPEPAPKFVNFEEYMKGLQE